MGCSGFASSHDVPEQPRPRVSCQTEWRGDLELAGGEEIKAVCARACRGHVRKDFAAAGASCQTCFGLSTGVLIRARMDNVLSVPSAIRPDEGPLQTITLGDARSFVC